MSKKYIDELSLVITKIRDKRLAKAFLQNILTPSELDEISTRLQIVKLLKKGIPQRNVAKKLNVSIGTVGRGARELKYGAHGFNKIIV